MRDSKVEGKLLEGERKIRRKTEEKNQRARQREIERQKEEEEEKKENEQDKEGGWAKEGREGRVIQRETENREKFTQPAVFSGLKLSSCVSSSQETQFSQEVKRVDQIYVNKSRQKMMSLEREGLGVEIWYGWLRTIQH